MSTYLLETTICSHLMKENLIVKKRLDKLTTLDAYFTIPIVQGPRKTSGSFPIVVLLTCFNNIKLCRNSSPMKMWEN